jgi:DNA-binding transcriptional regulator YiaG
MQVGLGAATQGKQVSARLCQPKPGCILSVKAKALKTTSLAPAPIRILPRDTAVKRLRISNLLTQTELAELAGVPQDHVDLYERGLLVPLDSRRRILKVLWAAKSKK